MENAHISSLQGYTSYIFWLDAECAAQATCMDALGKIILDIQLGNEHSHTPAFVLIKLRTERSSSWSWGQRSHWNDVQHTHTHWVGVGIGSGTDGFGGSSDRWKAHFWRMERNDTSELEPATIFYYYNKDESKKHQAHFPGLIFTEYGRVMKSTPHNHKRMNTDLRHFLKLINTFVRF